MAIQVAHTTLLLLILLLIGMISILIIDQAEKTGLGFGGPISRDISPISICEEKWICIDSDTRGYQALDYSVLDFNGQPLCGILRQVDCGTNERCVDGSCILKTCSQQGGFLCNENEFCPGNELVSSDAGVCCNTNCESVCSPGDSYNQNDNTCTAEFLAISGGTGTIYKFGTDWAVMRDSPTGIVISPNPLIVETSFYPDAIHQGNEDLDLYQIFRSTLVFDTSRLSDIPVNTEISSVELIVYPTERSDITIKKTTQLNPNELRDEDYGNILLGETLISREMERFILNQENAIPLDPSDISTIDFTLLGLLERHDHRNIPFVSETNDPVVYRLKLDGAGQQNPPRLKVVYTFDVCGDGMLTGLEECDYGDDGQSGSFDDDVGEETCSILLGRTGQLLCSQDCKFDTSQCQGFDFQYENDMDLTDNVLVIYNTNSQDSLEIAEYYANARGIDFSRLCPIKLPTGQFATGDQLIGARNTIIENCVCNIIPDDDRPQPCDVSNNDEIGRVSPITHLAIIRGVPPRLTQTGLSEVVDAEEPSLDYQLALKLYSKTSTIGGGRNRYWGLQSDDDLQTSYSMSGYIRPIFIPFDGTVAYGRIEAITKERTFELIDRTLEAEQNGISGNFLVNLDNDPAVSIDGGVFPFFRELTSSLGNECVDYIVEESDWPFETCRAGAVIEEKIPGESGSLIPRAMNAGVFIGPHSGAGLHNAFNGFNTMLNWHKSSYDCTTLCKDFSDSIEEALCRENSKDYFKEINTECVGVAKGFLGFKFRSWPVQYYGFWPPGWTVQSTDGATEKTAPIILSGDAYQDAQFTDDKYLRFGAVDAVGNPECILGDGGVESCPEMIAINLRKSIYPNPSITIIGSKTITLRFRLRNSASPNGKFSIKVYARFDGDSSNYLKLNRLSGLDAGADNWITKEFDIIFDEDGQVINRLLLDVQSGLDNPPAGWLELDGFELIDVDAGENVLDVAEGSFAAPYIDNTKPGDWAANVIDRLGGIAWWGSSSHYAAGYSFYNINAFVGAFYSGRSLGESLIHTGPAAKGGIIYGDTLYRPSGTKIYLDDGLVLLNDPGEGYEFNQADGSASRKIFINAFNGRNNSVDTQWQLSVCYEDEIDDCAGTGAWIEFESGEGIVFEEEISAGLMDLIQNPNSDARFIVRLKVWNPAQPENDLKNYGYFSYHASLSVA